MNIEYVLASVTQKLWVGKGSVELSMMNLEPVPNSPPPPPFPRHRILKKENQNPLTYHHQPAYILIMKGRGEKENYRTIQYNHIDKWKVDESLFAILSRKEIDTN